MLFNGIILVTSWCCIIDNTVQLLVVSTYFRFFNGRNSHMRLDVNTGLHHVTAENVFNAHSIHQFQVIAYICLH